MQVAAQPLTPDFGATAPVAAATPITADEFAAWMAPLGPFEATPHLAVAVSGGRDSLALAVLAAEWTSARGGTVTAVTIDHGLRASSAAEARQVGAWMRRRELVHHVLAWPQSPGPGAQGMGASEAAARHARYALLEEFCRDRTILHLLVGHHRDDQAETRAMRRARSSGALGRAGMAAVRELPHVRVVRPLLDVARARITATLRARGQAWIEDPSNADIRFARARMRGELRETADVGGHILPMAGPDWAGARIAAEREISRIAARTAAIHPAGYATLDPARLAAVDRETAARLIANLVTCVGGRAYGPRTQRLLRLTDMLIGGGLGGGATLGGCVVHPAGSGKVRVARELAGIAPPRAPAGTGDRPWALTWDGRFQITLPAADETGPVPHDRDRPPLGAVGQFRARGVPEHPNSPGLDALPHAVRMTLPAICSGGQFRVCRLPFMAEPGCFAGKARFAPKNPVAGTVFATG